MDIFLYVSVGIIVYVLIIILLRKLDYWSKKKCNNCNNCCPYCKDPLERIRRNRLDYFVNYMTFQLFDFKRYKCINCTWEGRRWEKRFSGEF